MSEMKDQVQKCPLQTMSSPTEKEKPPNKRDAANMDWVWRRGKARQDFPSRSREALTSLYKAPERYFLEYCPEFQQNSSLSSFFLNICNKELASWMEEVLLWKEAQKKNYLLWLKGSTTTAYKYVSGVNIRK